MQTDATLLANNTQHCWAQQCCDLLRPFAWALRVILQSSFFKFEVSTILINSQLTAFIISVNLIVKNFCVR